MSNWPATGLFRRQLKGKEEHHPPVRTIMQITPWCTWFFWCKRLRFFYADPGFTIREAYF